MSGFFLNARTADNTRQQQNKGQGEDEQKAECPREIIIRHHGRLPVYDSVCQCISGTVQVLGIQACLRQLLRCGTGESGKGRVEWIDTADKEGAMDLLAAIHQCGRQGIADIAAYSARQCIEARRVGHIGARHGAQRDGAEGHEIQRHADAHNQQGGDEIEKSRIEGQLCEIVIRTEDDHKYRLSRAPVHPRNCKASRQRA